MADTEKKGFNWSEFVAMLFLVVLTGVVAWGTTWYYMDNKAEEERAVSDAQIASLQAQNATLEAKIKLDSAADLANSEPVTPAMIASGTYTLGGVEVTLVNGTATVGENTYTLDTKTVAYNADKSKAAVVIKETMGTPAVTSAAYLVSVTNKDGKASQVASASLSKDATVTSVTYGTDGKIGVITTTATVTTPTTTYYTTTGKTLVAVK